MLVRWCSISWFPKLTCCFISLIKDQKLRPKYVKLQNEPFIKKYELMNIDVGEWFRKAIQQADAVAANRSAARYVAWLVTDDFISF